MYLVRIFERMEDNHIFLSAAGVAFNTLLCFIPLVLIIFYVLGFYLDSASAVRTIDTYIDRLQLFPFQREQLKELVHATLTDFVQGSGLAGIIGIIGLIWTSSALFAALRTVLNRIYHFKDTHNVLVSKLKDFAMLSVVGVVLIIVMLVSHLLILAQEIFSKHLPRLAEHWLLTGVMPHVISVFIVFLAFTLLFRLLPDRRIRLSAIILSSLLASVLWEGAKLLISYYIVNLWSMGRVYGSYAIIIAVALYIYYSAVTLLFAAEVGEMHIERRALKRLFKEQQLRAAAKVLHKAQLDLPGL